MEPAGKDTINQAKQYLGNHWEDGCKCPCCGQNVKLYKRKITSAMAYGLILVHNHVGRHSHLPVHVEDFFKQKDCPSSVRGDFAKLRYWSLINRHSERPGYYSITPKGQFFVSGQICVPRYCFIFNNECYGFSDERTDINRALGDRFSYKELMGREFEPKYNTTAIQTKIFNS